MDAFICLDGFTLATYHLKENIPTKPTKMISLLGHSVVNKGDNCILNVIDANGNDLEIICRDQRQQEDW